MDTETCPVLFVDDEPNLLAAIQRQLRSQLDLHTAVNAAQGLEVLNSKGPFSVVVSDMRMPEMDGVEFLHRVRSTSPDTVRIMLTGNTDQDTAIRAVNEGSIFRFLNKPCSPPALLKAVEDAKVQYRLMMAEKQLLQKTLAGSVRLLTDILGIVNPEAFGRASSIRDLAREIAAPILIENQWELDIASMLCQLGVLSLPDDVLRRRESLSLLSPDELRLIREVPSISHRLLGNIPRLEGVAEIVLYSAKNFDGSGYPTDDVAGDRIPISSRVLRIANDLQPLIESGMRKDEAARDLSAHAERYDTRLFGPLLSKKPGSNPPLTEQESRSEIGVESLLPGQRVLKHIETSSGLLLVKEGTLLTDAGIERIRNFQKLVGVRLPIVVERNLSGEV